ncbi:MAG: phosphatase [Planctomycetaceae bacterium]|nr:phosphatase [Planctomycetaceae bacterium]
MGARILFPTTLAWNFLLGRILKIRNWWDFIDEHVIVGAFPFPFDVDKMAAEGVRAVVNTCNEYDGPVAQYEKHSIEQLHIPTIDFTSPSLENVKQGVAFVSRHVELGNTVYIHCKAGRGRSATVAICWLMAAKSMNPSQAQKHLLDHRSHVHSTLPERDVVKQFWNELLQSESQQASDDSLESADQTELAE